MRAARWLRKIRRSSFWKPCAPALQSDAARRLVDTAARSATTASIAAQIGMARGILQQVAALEMLQEQSAGNIAKAREWRSVIALPKYANAVDGALLLQQPVERARQPEIGQVLAREDLTWQVMRTRQLLDYLQEGAAQGEATDAFIDADDRGSIGPGQFSVRAIANRRSARDRHEVARASAGECALSIGCEPNGADRLA